MGIAYDVFGTGKTAIKANFGRYPESIRGDAYLTLVNPASQSRHGARTRSWTDANRNFVPECNLLDPRANGECGAMDNAGVRGGR